MSPHPDPSPGRDTRGSGLRESKKERTRAALSEAAIALATEHGYDATTIEAIAAEADVSVRTFHNYFPSKFDAFEHGIRSLIALVAGHLAEAPDDLDALSAIRHAWETMLDSGHDGLPELVDTIFTGPTLLSGLAQNPQDLTAPLVAEFGRRTGTDPATSIVPWVGFDMAFTVLGWTKHHGINADFDSAAPTDRLALAFDAFEALRTPPADDPGTGSARPTPSPTDDQPRPPAEEN